MEIENNTFSRLVRISNIHGIGADDTITKFRVNLNRMTETNNIVRAVCKSVSFPNNAYNIYTEGVFKNNDFNFEVVGIGTFTVTISPAGFYNTQQLIDIIKPIIDTQVKAVVAGANFEMKIGEFSKKIEYSIDQAGVAVDIPGADGDGGLNGTLGNTEPLTVAFPNTAISELLPDLYGLKTCYVHSKTLAEGNLVDGDVENHDVVAEVPINAGYGGYVYYESRDDELDAVNYDSVRNYDNVEISLRDLDNNLIELNGGVFTIVLKVYYI